MGPLSKFSGDPPFLSSPREEIRNTENRLRPGYPFWGDQTPGCGPQSGKPLLRRNLELGKPPMESPVLLGGLGLLEALEKERRNNPARWMAPNFLRYSPPRRRGFMPRLMG